MGANYCDVCVSVCLSVCLSAHISQKPHGRTSLMFRTCCLYGQPWLDPLQGRYVMYFRFRGWHFLHNGTNVYACNATSVLPGHYITLIGSHTLRVKCSCWRAPPRNHVYDTRWLGQLNGLADILPRIAVVCQRKWLRRFQPYFSRR